MNNTNYNSKQCSNTINNSIVLCILIMYFYGTIVDSSKTSIDLSGSAHDKVMQYSLKKDRKCTFRIVSYDYT